MDIKLDEIQLDIAKEARRFLEKEMPMETVRELFEDDRGYTDGLWKKMSEMDWMKIRIPEAYGGAEMEQLDLCIILEEMGHQQPPTPLQTDNSMADGVVNGKIQPKRTKAMDMRFHWLRDRECQKQFRIYWRPGKSNYADYWTKHHLAKHHQNVRREFITPHIVVEMLRQEQAVHAASA